MPDQLFLEEINKGKIQFVIGYFKYNIAGIIFEFKIIVEQDNNAFIYFIDNRTGYIDRVIKNIDKDKIEIFKVNAEKDIKELSSIKNRFMGVMDGNYYCFMYYYQNKIYKINYAHLDLLDLIKNKEESDLRFKKIFDMLYKIKVHKE